MPQISSRRSGLWKLGSTILCAATMPNLAVASEDTYQASINNPPRLQWEANFGYCGEVSFISAGLRYGQYLSQYDARNIASNGTNQARQGSQLLLGNNAGWAAEQMLLKAVHWDNSGGPNPTGFLTWVKNGILANSSVIMAIYTNEYFFYDNTSAIAGDPQYDHIVPVTGVSSDFPLTAPATYYANDTITFSDNGLYTPKGKPIPYLYTYPDGSFQRTRKQANAQNSPPYSLPSAVKNFGMTISGIIDNDGQTLPVHIATNLNYEKPAIKHHSNTRPPPENLTLTVTVESLQPGQNYNLYRYNNFSSVPTSSFNAKKGQAAKSWQIQGTSNSSYTLTENILSDQIVVYRAVPVTAP